MWLRRRPRLPRSLAQALEALPHPWYSAPVPGGHLAVGPGGVYLLGAFEDSEEASNAAKAVRAAIDEEVDLRIWVQPVVVRWGRYTEIVEKERDVVYVHGGRIAQWLAERPGSLSLRQCHAVERALRDDEAA